MFCENDKSCSAFILMTCLTLYHRTSLAFRLMPQGNAILDCRPILAAGHVIPQSYVPVSVSQFMDDLSADEDTSSHDLVDTTCVRLFFLFSFPRIFLKDQQSEN